MLKLLMTNCTFFLRPLDTFSDSKLEKKIEVLKSNRPDIPVIQSVDGMGGLRHDHHGQWKLPQVDIKCLFVAYTGAKGVISLRYVCPSVFVSKCSLFIFRTQNYFL